MRGLRRRGFTLIEMLVVVAIIGILISVAVPSYRKSVQLAQEAVLRENLHVLRKTIDQFTLDKKRGPASLEELVSERYLRAIPRDITGSASTWRVEYADVFLAADQTSPGITDVHSGSDAPASDGTPFSSW